MEEKAPSFSLLPEKSLFALICPQQRDQRVLAEDVQTFPDQDLAEGGRFSPLQPLWAHVFCGKRLPKVTRQL